MKKLLLLALTVCLVGCVSPATQMINNKYLDVSATPPEAVGVWTASVGGGLSSIKLNQDGTGVLCEDNGNTVNVYQLRNSENLIYAQNGMSLKKTTINSNVLNVKTTLSAFNVEIKYRSDNDLKLLSARCAKELR